MLIMMFIVLIMTISVSFAVDNDTGGVTLSKNSDSNYGGVSNVKTNNAKSNDASFTTLSKEINSSSNKLVLNKNYKHTSYDSSKGIVRVLDKIIFDRNKSITPME